MNTPNTANVSPNKIIIHGVNLNETVVASVTNANWNCCDEPKPGTKYGYLTLPFTLAICRTGGHGCNGKQGTFQLGIYGSAGYLLIDINFDAGGNLETIVQNWTYTVPVHGAGPLHVTQRENDFFLWQLPVFDPEPDLWFNPRNLTDQESKDVERLFPHYDTGIKVWGSASQSPAFNCLAWALRITDRVFFEDTPPTVNQVIDLLARRGIQRVAEEETTNIIAWSVGNTVMHLTVLVGFPDGIPRWSSKLGYAPEPGYPAVGLLVSHLFNAPEGGPYGSAGLFFYDPNGFQPF